MRCSFCGSVNPVDAAFCGACGKAFGDSDHYEQQPRRDSNRTAATSSVSDATRYLCAAVQLDSSLAERVIRDILDEEYKAPPSSPDVDLISVLRHALAARGRQLVRDLTVTVLLLAILVFLVRAAAAGVLIGLLLVWLVLVVEKLVTTYGVVARDLGPGRSATVPIRRSSTWAEQRLAQIGPAAVGNVTVYGSYSPFVGSGFPVDAWSFALDIERAGEGRQVESFSTHEIHDHLLAHLRRLSVARVAIDDRVFVDGRDLRGDHRFLTNELSPPVSQIDQSVLRALMIAPEDRARPYLCLRVSGWRGQLVLSTFLRFVLTGNNLFVELSHSLLTPVQQEYQEVDRLLPQPTFGQLMRIVGRCLRHLPVGLFTAPLAVGRAALTPVSRAMRRARQRREILSALRFNYGATTSPRELASDARYQRYFQELDKALYAKVVEKQILQAIIDFLDEKGVDTSELVERQTTILNQGVYVTGGTVTADSIAAGPGARAKAVVKNGRATTKGS